MPQFFAFYWFGVKPQMNCLDKLEMQQEALEMQQLQMQVHIAALPVDENVMRSKKAAGRIRKSFLSISD